jgi:phenylalanyl-tRNA synthetase alpha subunit
MENNLFDKAIEEAKTAHNKEYEILERKFTELKNTTIKEEENWNENKKKINIKARSISTKNCYIKKTIK